MNTITIQPSDRVDGISPDGTERTQRPYPFHVSPDGMVQRQDFWRGRVYRVIGFTETPNARTIKPSLTWRRIVRRPFDMIGKYVVTADDAGNFSTHQLAISDVRIDGAQERYLVGGNGRWGQGLSEAEAKANFTRFGGRLSDGYEVVQFGPDVTFGGVDSMGRYHWAAVGDSEAQPVIKLVKPRRAAGIRTI